MSPDINMRTPASVFGAYWMYELARGMASGYWTVEVRIDGQPAGSHPFELVVPAEAAVNVQPLSPPERPANLSADEIYRATRDSVVWVHKLNETGRRVGTGSGFVLAPGQVATAFQVIDSAARVEVEFEGGKRVITDQVVGCNCLQDWAVLKVDTGDRKALRTGDPSKVAVAERLLVFNVENRRERTFGGVDISGRQTLAVFGERLQLNPPPGLEAAGGLLLSPAGSVVGIIGGSVIPGGRFDDQNLSINPSLFFSLHANNAATPVNLVRAEPATRTFVDLQNPGVLSQAVQSIAPFLYGTTSTPVKKLPAGLCPRVAASFPGGIPRWECIRYGSGRARFPAA